MWIFTCACWTGSGWTKPFWFQTSTHKDLSERLAQCNRSLYVQVKEILDRNKAERHIRGGIATRKKYKGSSE